MPTIYLVCLSKTIINYSSSISITRRRQRVESDPAVVYELRKNFTLSLEYSISIQHTYVHTYLALGLCFGSVLGTLSYSTVYTTTAAASRLLETPIIIAIVAGMIHRQIFEYISPPLDNDRELRTSRQNCTCRHARALSLCS